jgi:conjugative relaxase-like TrwC/TraI family protein
VGVLTVRVTTLKGPDAGRYYVEDLPRYYLEAGEPPGRWAGRGAALSGLVGLVDAEEFVSVLSGEDPSTGSPRGRRYGADSVRGYDVTCSAPKSVSVLWAVADEPVRAEVVAAHDAAVLAVVGFIDDQATTRPCLGRRVVVVDAAGVTAALFRQHTSRALDPQLHTHAVISAKVQAPDGRWLALDGRMIKCDQRTLSAIYHASLRAELSRRLGVAWRSPENGIAELATADPEVLAGFSSRTRDYEDRLAVKLSRFRESVGREPTARERWRLEREAVRDSRPAKTKAQHPDVLHARWRRQLLDLGHEPERLTRAAIGAARAAELTGPGVTAMVDQALAALAERESTWRRNDLIRELARAVPPTLTLEPGTLVGWLEQVADHVIDHQLLEFAPPAPPGTPRRRDGRPITESTLDRRFTTAAIVAEEERILDHVARRAAQSGIPLPVPDADLDPAQRSVAEAVAGTKQVVLVVGPAGTGKTTALRPAVRSLWDQGRLVIGVAPSATAAGILRAEAGMAADTIDKLLHDHRNPDHLPLPAATTIVVDEAGMVATPKLAELCDLADHHDWRLVLVGDPLQLSAVGRGGMFALLTETHPTVTLDHVHRFTHTWERQASLQLRAGDPSALDTYDRHGRITATTPDQLDAEAVARWDTARRHGTVAVLCPTNEQAAHLNQRIQQHRLDHLDLDRAQHRKLPNGQVLHVGDTVATRRNDRRLTTDRGIIVKNRARWTVTALAMTGDITLAGPDGTIQLPQDYADQHLELAYAETIHAAQGRTVDHAILLADDTLDSRSVYVGLTRGRTDNHVLVTTGADQHALQVLERALADTAADLPAVTVRYRTLTDQGQAIER